MKRTRIRQLIVVLTAIASACVGGPAFAAPTTPAGDQPFTSAIFLATHNSYSGNLDGAKNSITYQLDHGVRFIELDIHDNDYATNHDYSIGHSSPGDLVDHSGGNPASNLLHDWLDVIASWSNAHPTHAPLVVMLDIKDNLTDNTSYAQGNLAALNDELTSAFGQSLLRAKDYPASGPTVLNASAPASGPTVNQLRGRVLTLLSGDGTTRASYKRDVGYHPSVAIDGRGHIVEVHDSGAGALWYWTGTYTANGQVTWLRHGRYDSGQTPAVALNANGDLVEVHQSQNLTTLWYHVGHLTADGDITWSASHQYDNGVLPSVAFTSQGTLREIHRSQGSSQNWDWTGTLDASADTVDWTGNAKTSDARYDTSTATDGGTSVHVYTGADGPTPAQTLRYSTNTVTGGRIAYQQTAFDEYQDGDSAELQQGALFYAAPATDSSFIENARKSGHLARGWDFDSASDATSPLANYPATNTPYADWYQSMMTSAGAVQ